MTREEAIKELSYIADEMPSMECANWIEAISVGIKTLEQTRWIPVSERLPEDSGEYLVWIKPYGEKSYVSIEEIDCEGIIKKWNSIVANEIVAWMPLPESYNASPTGEEAAE